MTLLGIKYVQMESYAYRMQPTGLKLTYRVGVIGYLAGIK